MPVDLSFFLYEIISIFWWSDEFSKMMLVIWRPRTLFRRFAHRKHSQSDARMNLAFFKLEGIIGWMIFFANTLIYRKSSFDCRMERILPPVSWHRPFFLFKADTEKSFNVLYQISNISHIVSRFLIFFIIGIVSRLSITNLVCRYRTSFIRSYRYWFRYPWQMSRPAPS